LEVRVHDARCRSYIGMEGTVVDETARLLMIQDRAGKVKKILKNHVKFLFTLPDGSRILVLGKSILGRPWDRLKNIGKRKKAIDVQRVG